MDDLKPLKTAVKTAYNLLPPNSKKDASRYQNCSPVYFGQIVIGEPKKAKTYIKALDSIQKVSLKEYKKVIKNHTKICAIASVYIPSKQSEVRING